MEIQIGNVKFEDVQVVKLEGLKANGEQFSLSLFASEAVEWATRLTDAESSN